MGDREQESFGAWLRREMNARGYDVDSPRGGGRTAIATESGVSISIISRILTGERTAEPDTLRKLGRVLGYSLGEMMVFAELAGPDEMIAPPAATDRVTVSDSAGAHVTPAPPPDDVPEDVKTAWANLPVAERWLWRTPQTPPEVRNTFVVMLKAQEAAVAAYAARLREPEQRKRMSS